MCWIVWLCAEQPINEAVITVPSYFNQAERRAMSRAADAAGLRVLQLINDNTAGNGSYNYSVIGCCLWLPASYHCHLHVSFSPSNVLELILLKLLYNVPLSAIEVLLSKFILSVPDKKLEGKPLLKDFGKEYKLNCDCVWQQDRILRL